MRGHAVCILHMLIYTNKRSWKIWVSELPVKISHFKEKLLAEWFKNQFEKSSFNQKNRIILDSFRLEEGSFVNYVWILIQNEEFIDENESIHLNVECFKLNHQSRCSIDQCKWIWIFFNNNDIWNINANTIILQAWWRWWRRWWWWWKPPVMMFC